MLLLFKQFFRSI